jgi:hypothetical protein
MAGCEGVGIGAEDRLAEVGHAVDSAGAIAGRGDKSSTRSLTVTAPWVR